MDVEEVIRLMRTCTIGQIRAQLQLAARKRPEVVTIIASFYKAASIRKRK